MKHPTVGRTSRPGFTLVEMAVVLVILGALATIGLPRYATAMRHQRVNQAAQVVAADLELAMAMAAGQRVPLELRVDATDPGYVVATRADSVLLRRALGAGSEWQLAAASASPPTLTLFPAGTTSAAFRIVLGGADYQRTVTMTRAGLVRVRP
jgi:prepilin-type N-terminal cleavage/methylation domain-containing protein